MHPRSLFAVACGLLVVALSLVGASALRRQYQGAADARQTRLAGEYIGAVVDSVADDLSAVRVFASLTASNPALVSGAPPAGSLTVGTARFAGTTLRSTAGGVDEAVVGAPELAVAAGRARDAGRTILVGPVGGAIAVVVALYDGGNGLTTDPPGPTTEERRTSSTGFVVATLDPATFLPDRLPPFEVRDGSVVVAGTPPTGEVLARLPFPVRGRTWNVAVPQVGVGVPFAAVATALGGVLAGCLVVVLFFASARDVRRVRAESTARSGQADILRRFAEVVQHSLDVADVLPAVAVLLHDDLGISGVSISTFEAGGSDRAIFSDGNPTDPNVHPLARVPEAVAAGDTVAVALRSGGRAIATARLRAGRRLEQIELESLAAACELLTAALVNAQAFERQEAAMHALRDLDELKTVFLGVASHELRTPVTAIGGFARMLNERWDSISEDQRVLLMSRIVANAAALGSLVQDLLDFSRLERGRFVVAAEPIDLADRVKAVLDRLSPIWDGRDVRLHTEQEPWIRGDLDALERVVANLVSNAVKFSPPEAAVDVTVRAENGTGILLVDDGGPGVPADDREKIFSRFFRGEGPEVVRTRGAGIGLSVVKEFVDQMGGSITVTVSPAGGARFEVRLACLPDTEVPVATSSN